MSNVEDSFCPNKDCKDFGVRNQGNIGKRGKYGKNMPEAQLDALKIENLDQKHQQWRQV